ncbi:hypothetical protein ACLKA6_006997 [Drosophila palustris]
MRPRPGPGQRPRPRPHANGRLAAVALIINAISVVLLMMTAPPTLAEIPSKADHPISFRDIYGGTGGSSSKMRRAYSAVQYLMVEIDGADSP